MGRVFVPWERAAGPPSFKVVSQLFSGPVTTTEVVSDAESRK